MTDLTRREHLPEIMDDLSLPEVALAPVLSGLHRLNTLSGGAYFLKAAINKLIPENYRHPVTILDLGCGGGEILCAIVAHCRSRGVDAFGVGVDINPVSVSWANNHALKNNISARFTIASAIEAAKSLNYDIVCSSLFLHHLSNHDISELFNVISKRAVMGMAMSDLERSKTGYFLTYIATRLLSRSRIIQQDGLQSVRNALVADEFFDLARQAGLSKPEISRIFPSRLLLSWKR